MDTERTHCDKCKSKIYNGKCSCGFWYQKDKQPEVLKTFERAIFAYDFHCEEHNNRLPLSMDHYTGNCAVYFKGNYEDCMKVKEFINSLIKE